MVQLTQCMKDKILRFLDNYNIDYVSDGHNVKHGHVNISCPLCSDDPSEHMGIRLNNGVSSCWRNKTHQGLSFIKLITILLTCSYRGARQLFGDSMIMVDEGETLESILKGLDPVDDKINKPPRKKLKMVSGCMTIKKCGLTRRFWNYLYRRGFEDVEWLVNTYRIGCCLDGDWINRILFPIYYNGELMTWVGRSIFDNARLPYMDLFEERSIKKPKVCIYNFDALMVGGKVLFLVEGIFDVLKLEYYLPSNYKAGCLFTKTMTSQQMYLLSILAKKFDTICVLLDVDAEEQGHSLVGELSCVGCPVTFGELPYGVGDPGGMNEKQVLSLL